MRSANELCREILPNDYVIGNGWPNGTLGEVRLRFYNAIQQAREDGARWAQTAIVEAAMPEGKQDVTMKFAELLIAANARSVAP
jgi:hypothetical protein